MGLVLPTTQIVINMNTILVTGGGGYIGSILVRLLLEKGYNVKCLDRFFFGIETVSELLNNNNFQVIRDDIRWFNPKILKDVDCVMDLASLSNDPSSELDPSKTYDINFLGRVRVANLSKEYSVKKYILASSCSIYGAQTETANENSIPNPLTVYAKSNLLAEKEILPLADENFCVTVLRQATVYGLSSRMRFDLAINAMVLNVFKSKKLKLMRDGTQWRPFVHIKDTSNAFIEVVETVDEKVNGQVFNVGSNEQNIQIKELPDIIRNIISTDFEIEWYGDPDMRSYRVDFSKIANIIGFKPEFTPKDGVKEIVDALAANKVTDSIKTKTVDWYKHLLESQKLVNDISINSMII